MSCPYANALGVPREGVHAKRIFGLAQNDILATIVLSVITAVAFKMPFLYTLIGWFIIGELLHYIFGVNTAFLHMIGITPCKN